MPGSIHDGDHPGEWPNITDSALEKLSDLPEGHMQKVSYDDLMKEAQKDQEASQIEDPEEARAAADAEAPFVDKALQHLDKEHKAHRQMHSNEHGPGLMPAVAPINMAKKDYHFHKAIKQIDKAKEASDQARQDYRVEQDPEQP